MARTKKILEHVTAYIEIYVPKSTHWPNGRTHGCVSIIYNSNYGPKTLQVRRPDIWIGDDKSNDSRIKDTVKELRRWAKKNNCTIKEEKVVNWPIQTD